MIIEQVVVQDKNEEVKDVKIEGNNLIVEDEFVESPPLLNEDF